MIPGVYQIPDQYKDTTYDGVQFTIQDNCTRVGIDLTDATIRCQFKKGSERGSVEKTLEIGTGITVDDAVNGIIKINSFLVDFPVATYYYDIRITFPNMEVKTYIKGTMKVKQNITT